MKSYSLLLGRNILADSSVTGNVKAYSLFGGKNTLGRGSSITGSVMSKGIISQGPRGNISLGTNVKKDMDYTHTEQDKK